MAFPSFLCSFNVFSKLFFFLWYPMQVHICAKWCEDPKVLQYQEFLRVVVMLGPVSVKKKKEKRSKLNGLASLALTRTVDSKGANAVTS